MTDTTVERVEHITTADVVGLVGDTTHPVSADPATWVAAASAKRTAQLRRFLATVTTAPLTGKPWVPDLVPPEIGGAQQVEKGEIVGAAPLHVDGETVTPVLVGAAANVSWQVYSQAAAVIDVLLAESALRWTVRYIVGQLESGAQTRPTIAEAAGLVESSGWTFDFVAGPTGLLLGEDVVKLTELGVSVIGGVPSTAVLVGSLSAIWCQVSESDARVAEPSIGGYEVSSLVEVVCEVASSDGIVRVGV